MRKLVSVLTSLFMTSNAFAVDVIRIRTDDTASLNTTGSIDLTKALVPGKTYYYQDQNDWVFSGIYIGKDSDGVSLITDKQDEGFVRSGKSIERDGPDAIQPFTTTPTDPQQNEHSSNGLISMGGIPAHVYQTGAAVAIYRGLIQNSAHREALRRYESADAENRRKTNAYNQSLAQAQKEGLQDLSEAIAVLSSMTSIVQNDAIQPSSFHSKNPGLVRELQETETILRGLRPKNARQMDAKTYGLAMIQCSDRSAINGDEQTARGFARLASALADIAIGFTPIIGPLRDTYEAVTGRNLLTQESLSSFERSMAVVGAATFGFGSAFSEGLRLLKVAELSSEFSHVAETAERIIMDIEKGIDARSTAAHSLANKDRYVRELRRQMEMPYIRDSKLAKTVKGLWRDAAIIGNKSTAAAVRYERLTGLPVGGTFHTSKARQYLANLTHWLEMDERNIKRSLPAAHPSDRQAVENIILDLRDALGFEI